VSGPACLTYCKYCHEEVGDGPCDCQDATKALRAEVTRLQKVNRDSDAWHAKKYAELRKEGADARAEVAELRKALKTFVDLAHAEGMLPTCDDVLCDFVWCVAVRTGAAVLDQGANTYAADRALKP